jgi:hypothetical protein
VKLCGHGAVRREIGQIVALKISPAEFSHSLGRERSLAPRQNADARLGGRAADLPNVGKGWKAAIARLPENGR